MALDTELTTATKYLQGATPKRKSLKKDILVKAKLSKLNNLFLASCRSPEARQHSLNSAIFGSSIWKTGTQFLSWPRPHMGTEPKVEISQMNHPQGTVCCSKVIYCPYYPLSFPGTQRVGGGFQLTGAQMIKRYNKTYSLNPQVGNSLRSVKIFQAETCSKSCEH